MRRKQLSHEDTKARSERSGALGQRRWRLLSEAMADARVPASPLPWCLCVFVAKSNRRCTAQRIIHLRNYFSSSLRQRKSHIRIAALRSDLAAAARDDEVLASVHRVGRGRGVTGGRQLRSPEFLAGYATPATYSVNGRQYLVIACGGGKIGTKSGDAYVAFALPK